MPLPEMTKHRGFPSGLYGTGFQFTIRRANPKGATKLVARPRHADRDPLDLKADAAFLHSLWHYFGDEPFERGNLDAGRLSWLLGREVVALDPKFDAQDYGAMFRIDVEVAQRSFPHAFEEIFEV